MCANFQTKQKEELWLFGPKFAQKVILEFEFQKINVGIRISILDIPCMTIFRQNRQLWLFEPEFAQNGFWSWKFKNLSLNSESVLPTYLVSQFSVKTENFEFFRLNLGKLLPNYVWYFGSNIVEGIVESWVEAEISWVEVDRSGWRWMKLGGAGRMV